MYVGHTCTSWCWLWHVYFNFLLLLIIALIFVVQCRYKALAICPCHHVQCFKNTQHTSVTSQLPHHHHLIAQSTWNVASPGTTAPLLHTSAGGWMLSSRIKTAFWLLILFYFYFLLLNVFLFSFILLPERPADCKTAFLQRSGKPAAL